MSNWKVEFAQVMKGLSSAFDRELTEDLLKIYAASLADVPIEHLKQAAHRHINNGEFFPRVSELRGNSGAKYRQEWEQKRQIAAERTREDYLRIAQRQQAPLANNGEIKKLSFRDMNGDAS